VLKVYDQILAKQKFIGGETFTIADVFHLPYLTLFAKIGESENLWKDLPNVERWYKEITERESVKACAT
jgi:glutathione S-transferase